ncbi:MAG TPA: DUF1150 family protein [Acetobacteraceae bacterium]|nr:DUF1150 family protein [Acetobacteraceae bacterium]
MNIGNNDETGEMVLNAAPLDIRHLSEGQLASLGVSEIAYLKPVVVNGTPAFAIHAADGTAMALAGDAEVAMAAIRQHGMEPVRVH